MGVTGGLLYPQAVDVQMQSMALRGPDGEPQPGLESQGRAASMPRLAAETQVGGLGGLGSWEGVEGEETWHRGALHPTGGLCWGEASQMLRVQDNPNPIGNPLEVLSGHLEYPLPTVLSACLGTKACSPQVALCPRPSLSLSLGHTSPTLALLLPQKSTPPPATLSPFMSSKRPGG